MCTALHCATPQVVPNAVTLILSAEIDHAKAEYRTGYGFQLNL
jgi:hypothetical protein